MKKETKQKIKAFFQKSWKIIKVTFSTIGQWLKAMNHTLTSTEVKYCINCKNLAYISSVYSNAQGTGTKHFFYIIMNNGCKLEISTIAESPTSTPALTKLRELFINNIDYSTIKILHTEYPDIYINLR